MEKLSLALSFFFFKKCLHRFTLLCVGTWKAITYWIIYFDKLFFSIHLEKIFLKLLKNLKMLSNTLQINENFNLLMNMKCQDFMVQSLEESFNIHN